MVRIVCIGSLVLAAVTAVSGHVIRWKHKAPPPYWETDILESYDVYHERYLNWGCDKQHKTTFFDKCCHPLLKDECIDVLEDLGCPPPGPLASSHPPASPSPPATTPSPKQDNPVKSPPTTTHTTTTAPPKQFNPVINPVINTPATTHTTTTPKETPSSSPAPSDGDFNFGGEATWFTQNGVAGACGTVHSDNDFIAAMDIERYGNTGNNSPLCGRKVLIYSTADESQSVTVIVADACPTCKNGNSIDLSVAAFKQLAALGVGVVPIKWKFVS